MAVSVLDVIKDGQRKLKLIEVDNLLSEDLILQRPDDVVRFLVNQFKIKEKIEENVYMICMGNTCEVKGVFHIAKGVENKALISVKQSLMKALLCDTTRIVIAHNHVSGNTKPSLEDMKITKGFKEGCKYMGIEFADHVIIGTDYTSMSEMCLI